MLSVQASAVAVRPFFIAHRRTSFFDFARLLLDFWEIAIFLIAAEHVILDASPWHIMIKCSDRT